MSIAESCFDASVTSMGVLSSIIEALDRYDLFHFFVSWFHDSTFPTYSNWKCIVKTKVRNFEDNAWADFCVNQPGMHIAQACLKNAIPCQFWCLTDNCPDLVSRVHTQIRLTGNFGVTWHAGTNDSFCLICKQGSEDVTHFLLDCFFFKENVDPVWLNIKARITETNPLDGTQICNFISNLDRDSKGLLLLGGGGGWMICHCQTIMRRQSLSIDSCCQLSEKSLNPILINANKISNPHTNKY